MSGTSGGGGGITNLGGSKYTFTLDISDLATNINSAEQAVQQATNRIVALLQTIDPAAKLATAGIKDLDQATRATSTGAGGLGTRLGTLNTRLAAVGQGGNTAGGALTQVGTAARTAGQAATTSAANVQALTQALQASAAAAQASAAGLATMQQQAQAAQRAATGATAGGGGSSLGGQLGGAALAGLGIGAGFGTAQLAVQGVTKAVAEAKASVIDYNAAIESASARIRAFTGSQQAVTESMALARREFAAGRGTYTDLLNSIAELTPLARNANVPMQDLLRTAQLLAAADPVQGLRGAQVALREALSGNFISLSRRFEIPMTMINQLKQEGLPNIEIVRQALEKMGYTEKLLSEQANTWDAQQRILTDGLKQLGAEAGKPIFDGLEAGIKRLNVAVTGNNAAVFAQQVAFAFKGIGETFDLIGRSVRVVGDGIMLTLLAVSTAINSAVASWFETLGKLPGTMGDKYREAAATFRAEADKSYAAMQVANKQLTDNLNATGDFAKRMADEKFVPAGAAAAKGLGDGAQANSPAPTFNKLGADSALAFIQGMSKAQLGALDSLNQYAEGALYGNAAKKGYDPANLLGPIRDALPGVIAGADGAAEALKKVAPPEVYAQIMRYVGALNDATTAASQLAVASRLVGVMQGRLKGVQEEAKKANKEAADAVTAAQKAAQDHADAYDQRLQDMRDASDAGKHQAADERQQRQEAIRQLQDEAAAQQTTRQDALRGLQEQATAEKDARTAAIQGLQDEATAQQAAQAERMRGIDAQVQAAQLAQEQAQALTRQHAAMLTAISQGQADAYIAEVGQIDAVSQRLYDRYAKELESLLAVKNAKDAAARAGHEQTDARVLQYEEAIHAAYNAGNIGQARLLQQQEQRYQSQASFQNSLLDQRAKVASNQLGDAQTRLQREGQAQTAEDRGAEANTKRALQAVQDVKTAQAEADRVANAAQAARIKDAQEADRVASAAMQARIKTAQEEDRRASAAMQTRIKDAQEADRQANQDATDHQKIVDAEIKAVERQKSDTARADKQAIIDAQDHATIVKNEWQDKVDKAGALVTKAQTAETAAKGQLTAMDGVVTDMRAVTDELRKWAEQYLPQIVDNLKQIAGAPGGGITEGNRQGDRVGSPGTPPPSGPGMGPQPQPPSYAPPKAGGGPVIAGSPLTVGEFGAETFVPQVPGFILPSDISARILGGAPRVPEMAAPQQRVIVNTPVSFPNLTIREEADIQKIGGAIARTMLAAQQSAIRQGTPMPGLIGG